MFIVHELAISSKRITPRKFWERSQTHVPKLDKALAWLNENGQVLEEGDMTGPYTSRDDCAMKASGFERTQRL